MADVILFNSSGELLFVILVMIPILLYLIWRIGYNLRKVKIPIILSVIGAFYFYFSTPDFILTFEQSLNIFVGRILVFNLLFFSTIFTIIILIVPSNQKMGNLTRASIIQRNIADSTPLLDWEDTKNTKFSASLENGFKKEKNPPIIVSKDLLNTLDKGSLDDDFQKLIDDLFEEQNKSQKE